MNRLCIVVACLASMFLTSVADAGLFFGRRNNVNVFVNGGGRGNVVVQQNRGFFRRNNNVNVVFGNRFVPRRNNVNVFVASNRGFGFNRVNSFHSHGFGFNQVNGFRLNSFGHRINTFGTRTVVDGSGNVFEVDAFGNSVFRGNAFGFGGGFSTSQSFFSSGFGY